MSVTFCHNHWIREKALKNTVKIEQTHFPSASFIISYNVKPPKDRFFNLMDTVYFGPNQGHKLGSLNGALFALNKAISLDNKDIVFSHDDVYLNDAELLSKNLKLLDKYDFVGRQITGTFSTDENPYIMLASFLITKSGCEKIVNKVNKINTLPKDNNNSPSPEIYFGSLVVQNLNCFLYKHFEDARDMDQLGYYHIKKPRGWTE